MPVSIGGSTGIGGNDGTVGTPAVRGSANNTGIYFPSAGNVAIAINGVQKVLIDNTGIIASNGVNLLSTFVANTATAVGQTLFSTDGLTFTPTQKLFRGSVNAGGTNPFPSSAGPTSVSYTDIPSWVKRITVTLSGVSTNGTSIPVIYIGGATSSYVTTAYSQVCSVIGASAVVSDATGTTGFPLVIGTSYMNASYLLNGSVTLVNITGNTWVITGITSTTGNPYTFFVSGTKTLTETLDRIRIATLNGTDLFDAGSINILYE